MADAKLLHITLVCATGPKQSFEVALDLPEGACVADALRACAAMESFAGIDTAGMEAGVWGRLAPLTQKLKTLDRVELYRPLTVDPKVARRERFANQGASRAGLFAKKRPGAKAGY